MSGEGVISPVSLRAKGAGVFAIGSRSVGPEFVSHDGESREWGKKLGRVMLLMLARFISFE